MYLLLHTLHWIYRYNAVLSARMAVEIKSRVEWLWEQMFAIGNLQTWIRELRRIQRDNLCCELARPLL